MTKRSSPSSSKILAVAAVAAATVLSSSTTTTEAFTAPTPFVAGNGRAASDATTTLMAPTTSSSTVVLSMAGEEEEASAVFVPPAEEQEEGADIGLDTVELLGKGAAKAKRGKRKGGPVAPAASTAKASATLAPEEVYYEGPPAITETIIPTISILTVVGIIPAIASWSRQAWVRYKITSRRIRVTSGIGGKDMAEIVYPDITEIRTAKRLFGDGDMVLFLRDGAKFEMRNVPEFEETMEFVLKQVSPEVAEQYREKGDVTNP
eukprot:CAMPEP_0113460462 /NCGR_PEP_ID=MMETSP0014_2-20120614/11001_1 /TAXON_ID=2857 /ORGANISM="Nitzschia sp." /LENGTH=262 /DNA_ID=CAMNT_0000352119 /DNA_START=168 /DNA_END=956 /DNA_ORIENTATION=+ /assembly_acc=CAM_ASM_000159